MERPIKNPVNDILRILDAWRHLPAYQLERRVDVLIGLFLPKVLRSLYALADEPVVIPEFPLHKRLLFGLKYDDSVKLDFAAFCCKPVPRVFFVELKTDKKSLRRPQLDRMATARCKGLLAVLEGVKEAAKASREKPKYAQLLWKLDEIGCVSVGDDFRCLTIAEHGRPNLKRHFCEVEIGREWSCVSPELLLIIPTKDCLERKDIGPEVLKPFSTLDFAGFADKIRAEGDFGQTLARYLVAWAGGNAGYINPWSETSAEPQSELEGTVTTLGDVIDPALPDDHWEGNAP